MAANNVAVNQRLLKYLESGKDISTNQARQRFGITNVTARINELRLAGYAIYSNTRKTSNGRSMRVWRLGTPTRRLIAAGYAARKDAFIQAKVAENFRLV
jgi:predicted ArsR family transcriptional regulator